MKTTKKKTLTQRMMAGTMSVVLAMGLAPAVALAAPADQALKAGGGDLLAQETTAASSVDVYMSISNQGTLALAHETVTVTDVNKDGKLTFDEALQAAHEKYCPVGKSGYAVVESTYGALVTKLWNVDVNGSALFYQNDVMIPVSVAAQEIQADDDLVAGAMKDIAGYTDCFSYFDKKQVNVKVGKKFTLTLKADRWGTALKAPNAQVGTWKNGKFTALSKTTTDADGKVTLSFKKPGTYVVSAAGTVDSGFATNCQLAAPYCVVKVGYDNTMKVSAKAATVKLAQVKKKAVSVSPITVTKAKGTKSFEVTKYQGKSKKYIKVNAKTGKVTVKKGAPKGTYKFKVKVTAKGNKNYLEKSVTKTITIKVKK